MRYAIALLLLGSAVVLVVHAQSTHPQFEVVSIKPTEAVPGSASGIQSLPGRIVGRNVTLKRCIRGAYDIPETLIFGGPKWVDEQRYDIEAKAADPVRDPALMLMLQSLLADRFHLAFHRERRQLSGYALMVAKSGLKAKPSAKDVPAKTSASLSGGSIDAQASTMANLAQKLSDTLHIPVTDLTKTEGKYDFKLSWNPKDVTLASADKLVAEPSAPSIFTALQEQLGLRMESRKVPVDVVVIDHAEKPSEN